MLELDTHNIIDYLIGRGFPGDPSRYRAERLAWGVSNIVLRVDIESDTPLVIKQSRAQLRTQAAWFSRLDRIYREADVMRVLHDLLPAGAVPAILFEDRQNYAFAMEAVAADHVVWKQMLLQGDADPGIAAQLGTYLATIHRETAGSADLRDWFGDTTVFDELRIDPFYRYLAGPHPDLRNRLETLVDETLQTQLCLVLADFSPKNILVTHTGLTLVDFETGHYGDPAFDLGFFLTHLVLKSLLHGRRRDDGLRLIHEFWKEYRSAAAPGSENAPPRDPDLPRRTIAHLGACILARVDGKSPVDYLSEPLQAQARELGRLLLLSPPATLEEALAHASK